MQHVRFLAAETALAVALVGSTITAAIWLCWALVVISMVWTFRMLALRRADIDGFPSRLMNKRAPVTHSWSLGTLKIIA